jgi:UDP-2-acetamido-2,6-beta-L-arabino-hexul-4-ose reductase
MVIGNGLLANAFLKIDENYDEYVIFASGVSNSLNTDNESFNKEKSLLLNVLNDNKTKKIIYFSSIMAGLINNDYYNHKIAIEEIIKDNSDNYIIFRLPQIIGNAGNKNNLFNIIKTSLLNNEEVIVYENVYRALIDIDDLVQLVNYLKDLINRQIINISNIEKVSVIDIVKTISKLINVEPKIKLVKNKTDNNWHVDNDIIVSEALAKLNISKLDYTNNIIKKYINK